VIADKNMIDLTLRNLLENAIKFSYEGGAITLGVHTEGDEVQVSVKDNGKGIAQADQAKIGGSTLSFTTIGTQKEKGSGLGLFLCRELIEKNGGKLWFKSEEGQGSTFYFTLPAKDTH
jgi:two-component system sensor histidine kinase/response regulator